MVVGDEFLGEPLGDVGRAGVVLEDEIDLLAGDRVAVLRDVKLGAGLLLLAGRGRRAGHRQDQADRHGVVVGARGARDKGRAKRRAQHPNFPHWPASSRFVRRRACSAATFSRSPTRAEGGGALVPRPVGRFRALESGENGVRQHAVVARFLSVWAQAEIANPLLPADGRPRHRAIESQEIDGQRHLAHLGRAADAMRHHPLEHVGGALPPVEARVGFVERIEHRLDHAGLLSGENAFADQRLEPLHHDRADHLDGGGAADRSGVDRHGHAQRCKRGRRRFGVRAADEERRAVQARMHGRHHGDIDITSARRFDRLGALGFGLRRAGIAIEEKRALLQPGRRGERRRMRLIGGDDGEHRVNPRDRLGRA